MARSENHQKLWEGSNQGCQIIQFMFCADSVENGLQQGKSASGKTSQTEAVVEMREIITQARAVIVTLGKGWKEKNFTECRGLRTWPAITLGACEARVCLFKKIFIYLAVPSLSLDKWDIVPPPGIKPGPLRWEHKVLLATGPPGKSPKVVLLIVTSLSPQILSHPLSPKKGNLYSAFSVLNNCYSEISLLF